VAPPVLSVSVPLPRNSEFTLWNSEVLGSELLGIAARVDIVGERSLFEVGGVGVPLQ
jgi:hypothetical protein